MNRSVAILAAAFCLMAGPALAISYPVSGRWGESSEPKPGPIDCAGKRVIRFEDMQRFDSNGGVPSFRMRSVTPAGDAAFSITEEFNTAQINARLTYRLNLIDADRIEIVLSPGGTIKLKRCQ